VRLARVLRRVVWQVAVALAVALVVGLLGAQLAGCSAVSGDDHTLTVACNLDDAVTFDPAVSGETLSVFVHNAAYDALTEVKAGDLGTVAPKLADSWTHSADLKTFTFTLHPGITFASGNALTAEDVRFTFQRAKNMKKATAAVLEAMASVEAPDALTVTFTLSWAAPGRHSAPTPRWASSTASW
jgi:ABC-type transport system substrate-binding protein